MDKGLVVGATCKADDDCITRSMELDGESAG